MKKKSLIIRVGLYCHAIVSVFIVFCCLEVNAQFDTEYYLPTLWSINAVNSDTNTPSHLIISTSYTTLKCRGVLGRDFYRW